MYWQILSPCWSPKPLLECQDVETAIGWRFNTIKCPFHGPMSSCPTTMLGDPDNAPLQQLELNTVTEPIHIRCLPQLQVCAFHHANHMIQCEQSGFLSLQPCIQLLSGHIGDVSRHPNKHDMIQWLILYWPCMEIGCEEPECPRQTPSTWTKPTNTQQSTSVHVGKQIGAGQYISHRTMPQTSVFIVHLNQAL